MIYGLGFRVGSEQGDLLYRGFYRDYIPFFPTKKPTEDNLKAVQQLADVRVNHPTASTLNSKSQV